VSNNFSLLVVRDIRDIAKNPIGKLTLHSIKPAVASPPFGQYQTILLGDRGVGLGQTPEPPPLAAAADNFSTGNDLDCKFAITFFRVRSTS